MEKKEENFAVSLSQKIFSFRFLLLILTLFSLLFAYLFLNICGADTERGAERLSRLHMVIETSVFY